MLKSIGIFVFGLIVGYCLSALNNNAETSLGNMNNVLDERTEITLRSNNNLEKVQDISNISTENIEAITETPLVEAPIDNNENNTIAIATTNNEMVVANNELIDKYQRLEEKHAQLLSKTRSLEKMLGEHYQSEITNEQLQLLTPTEFDNLIIGHTGKARDDIHDFHQADEDLDWGYSMSQKISDFISTHEKGFAIEMVSIICKDSSCELLLKEKQDSAFTPIMRQMNIEPWWRFNSHRSSSSGKEGEYIYYIYLSDFRHS